MQKYILKTDQEKNNLSYQQPVPLASYDITKLQNIEFRLLQNKFEISNFGLLTITYCKIITLKTPDL